MTPCLWDGDDCAAIRRKHDELLRDIEADREDRCSQSLIRDALNERITQLESALEMAQIAVNSANAKRDALQSRDTHWQAVTKASNPEDFAQGRELFLNSIAEQIKTIGAARDRAEAELAGERVEWQKRTLELEHRALMYGRAWERELGPPYRQKVHHIDAMVLTTRDRMNDLREFKARLTRVRAMLDKPESLDVAALKEALK